jgi:hypothetical protein
MSANDPLVQRLEAAGIDPPDDEGWGGGEILDRYEHGDKLRLISLLGR